MADLRLILADRQGDMLRDVTPLLACRRTEALDGTDSIDFTTCGVDVSKGQRLFFRDRMGRWHEYVVGTVTEGHDDGGETTVDVWAESAMAHDFRLSYVEDRRPSSLTAALAALEDVTRWRVGVVDVTSADTATWYLYHLDAWSALGKIVERYGGEPSARVVPTGDVPDGDGWTRYIDYSAHRGGATAARRFEWGHDVTSIKREVLDDDVVTAVWAWGKGEEIETGADGVAYGRRLGIEGVTPDGLGYVHDDSLLADWGLPGRAGEPPRHRFAEVVVDDCADASELLAIANARLYEWSVPRVSYSATVAQFGRAGVDFAGVALGDEVQVVDAGFATPIRTTARVVRIVTDELDSSQTKVTLDTWGGDYAADYAALVRSIGSLDGRSAAWDAVKDSAASYMDAQIAALNAMFASSGGYQFTDVETGTTWMDAPTFEQATTAINISGAGFRIADGKTAQGEWDWRTFGTGAGFTADDIVAGIIRSADGKSWWNLTTGEMRIGVGIVIGDEDSGCYMVIDDDSLSVHKDENEIAHFGYGDSATQGPIVHVMAPYATIGTRRLPTRSFSPGVAYSRGDLVIHDGGNYVCLVDMESPHQWVDGEWGLIVGEYSSVEGSECLASGAYSHAVGLHARALGITSHAVGSYCTAAESYSHAEGITSRALGYASHAEGYHATASGDYSHAEGNATSATGKGSTAFGYETVASGNYARADGFLTIASGMMQTALGKYNVEDANDTYAVIVGNGSGNARRSNAATLDWGGNLELAGTATLGTPLPIASGGTGATTDANAPWLRKSGGAMTGQIVGLTGTSGYINRSGTVQDATAAVTSNQGISYYHDYDGSNHRVGYTEIIREPNGVYRSFVVTNPSASKNFGIYFHVTDAGALTFNTSEAAASKAIAQGIGLDAPTVQTFYWSGGAYITNGQKQIVFTVPFRKPVNATGCTLTSVECIIRQNNGYRFGSSASVWVTPTTKQISNLYLDYGQAELMLDYPADSTTTNNDACGVRAKVTLTFTY